METQNYWIYKNKIIFKPEFNDKLDDYINIISEYDELIFSNYDDYNITIETNNTHFFKYNTNHTSSSFNHQVTIPENITHLIFGYDFNQQVTISQNVTNLTFGRMFNQQVIISENVT